MRTLTRKQKTLAALATAGIVLGGSGTAYAYWTTTGSGTGTGATTAGESHLTITQTSAPTNLAPGVAAGTISGTVTNDADNNAYVNTVTVSIDSVTKADGVTGGCDATDYTLSNPVMDVKTDLAKDASASFTGATLAFNDEADTNQDGCKGATVNLAYSSN